MKLLYKKNTELRCPMCGSFLHRQGKAGFICPNPKCEVIKVQFYRNSRKVKRVFKQGFTLLPKFSKDFS